LTGEVGGEAKNIWEVGDEARKMWEVGISKIKWEVGGDFFSKNDLICFFLVFFYAF
jgi:hypothetical protein